MYMVDSRLKNDIKPSSLTSERKIEFRENIWRYSL